MSTIRRVAVHRRAECAAMHCVRSIRTSEPGWRAGRQRVASVPRSVRAWRISRRPQDPRPTGRLCWPFIARRASRKNTRCLVGGGRAGRFWPGWPARCRFRASGVRPRRPACSSKPTGLAEAPEQQDVDAEHHRQADRIAVLVMEFGDALKIHPVDAGNHGRHREQGRE